MGGASIYFLFGPALNTRLKLSLAPTERSATSISPEAVAELSFDNRTLFFGCSRDKFVTDARLSLDTVYGAPLLPSLRYTRSALVRGSHLLPRLGSLDLLGCAFAHHLMCTGRRHFSVGFRYLGAYKKKRNPLHTGDMSTSNAPVAR